MVGQWPFQQRALAACWYEETKSVTSVQRRFRREDKNVAVPSRKAILKWHTSLFNTGSVLNKKHKRARHIRTEETSNAIIGAALGNPNISLRRLSTLFSIPLTSVYRILCDFSFHPYKLQTLQKLHDIP